jgi:hypothetical protein
MIFVPSRGRRKPLERFFRESAPVLAGRVLIDDDDIDTYLDVVLPGGWMFLAGERVGAAKSLNRGFKLFPDEPFYGVCGDDVVCTKDWDVILSEACQPDKVSWGDDGKFGERLGTTFFVGGDLVRKMGWLAHPDFGHLYVDRIWWEIGQGSGKKSYHPEVKTAHLNVHDETYRQRAVGKDHQTFPKLDLKELIDRVG